MKYQQYQLEKLYSKYEASNDEYVRFIGTYNYNTIIYDELSQIILT